MFHHHGNNVLLARQHKFLTWLTRLIYTYTYAAFLLSCRATYRSPEQITAFWRLRVDANISSKLFFALKRPCLHVTKLWHHFDCPPALECLKTER